MRALLTGFIRLYQTFLSPLLGPACRFEPTCSRYALAVIEQHGALRGSLLSLVRLCKCHPFHPGGYDPPPPRGARLGVWRIVNPTTLESASDPRTPGGSAR